MCYKWDALTCGATKVRLSAMAATVNLTSGSCCRAVAVGRWSMLSIGQGSSWSEVSLERKRGRGRRKRGRERNSKRVGREKEREKEGGRERNDQRVGGEGEVHFSSHCCHNRSEKMNYDELATR